MNGYKGNGAGRAPASRRSVVPSGLAALPTLVRRLKPPAKYDRPFGTKRRPVPIGIAVRNVLFYMEQRLATGAGGGHIFLCK